MPHAARIHPHSLYARGKAVSTTWHGFEGLTIRSSDPTGRTTFPMDTHGMNDPCYTCRRRRIQCDQSGVPCAKCDKSGFECFQQRPLRWVKGVTLRSKFHDSVLRPSAQTKHMSSKLRSKGGDAQVLIDDLALVTQLMPASLQHHQELSSGAAAQTLEDTENTLVVASPRKLSDQATSHLDKTSRYYLDYYNDRICKLFIVQDSDSNPLRSLIPLALHDSVLMNAVLTLAARHHANTGYSFRQQDTSIILPVPMNANRDALSYKYKAIQGLTSSVEHATSIKHDTTLASIFLLIFLDLLESGSDRWNVHLEGAKSLISCNKSLFELPSSVAYGPGQTMLQIRDFISSQIYLIGVLGGTFVRPKLLTKFSGLQQPELLPQDIVEQSFLGCPVYLLDAIQNLSAQRDIIADAEGIQSIQKFDCYKWATTLPRRQVPSHREITNLCSLASSYKLGAVIYGRRVLDACKGDDTSQAELVGELIMTIGSLQNDDTLFKCILWPIFVAGLESQWTSQRQFLGQCLERFWRLTLCFNVINAAKILNTYWQEKDHHSQSSTPSASPSPSSQWIFNMGRLGQDWLLI
ncbi:Regulatory protein GAL4 [Talaromyces islandicus]|uniref:Regulatory protein GAL4 n=1 Tax=Talaromyces islandicus TaxID=28573 RepID=A0A0U1LYF3_TALIS|nr:Regulatory protein GAL4 [Talaromyces islandicus]